jgi:hypothetical protein
LFFSGIPNYCRIPYVHADTFAHSPRSFERCHHLAVVGIGGEEEAFGGGSGEWLC